MSGDSVLRIETSPIRCTLHPAATVVDEGVAVNIDAPWLPADVRWGPANQVRFDELGLSVTFADIVRMCLRSPDRSVGASELQRHPLGPHAAASDAQNAPQPPPARG